MQDILRGTTIDAIVQPYPKPRYKLFVADMESTIIANECLDELADYVGLRAKIEAITARAMNGELDFAPALAERVGLLKGLTSRTLQEVYDKKVTLTPGAEALMTALKKQGISCMLVSGGFDFYAKRIKERLGFDEERSNKLQIKDGLLTGEVLPPILDKNAKLRALQEGCAKLGITPAEAIAIGDGANDLPMLLGAGLGVAYYAKPTVRAQAKAQINHGDLSSLIPALAAGSGSY
jgi:phosphoserine phosphatase